MLNSATAPSMPQEASSLQGLRTLSMLSTQIPSFQPHLEGRRVNLKPRPSLYISTTSTHTLSTTSPQYRLFHSVSGSIRLPVLNLRTEYLRPALIWELLPARSIQRSPLGPNLTQSWGTGLSVQVPGHARAGL